MSIKEVKKLYDKFKEQAPDGVDPDIWAINEITLFKNADIKRAYKKIKNKTR